MNSVAPVCPVSRDQPVPGSPGLLLPVIPAVIDLPSALQAANMLALMLPAMIGAVPTNNVHPPAAFGNAQLKAQNTGGLQASNWVENPQRRQITKKRIYQVDPNTGQQNQSVYVDVERLMHMEMVNTVTGDTLVWDYGDDSDQ